LRVNDFLFSNAEIRKEGDTVVITMGGGEYRREYKLNEKEALKLLIDSVKYLSYYSSKIPQERLEKPREKVYKLAEALEVLPTALGGNLWVGDVYGRPFHFRAKDELDAIRKVAIKRLKYTPTLADIILSMYSHRR